MAGQEPIAAEAEESKLVVAGEVVAEVMEREAPSAGEAMGSVEYLGRWKEKRPPYFPLVQRDERAMPVKMTDMHQGMHVDEGAARIAFSRLVDELVQKKAPSGVLAFSTWVEEDDDGPSTKYWGFSWSASADDESYQRHGFVRMESTQHENIRFADFEGVIDDVGDGGLAADSIAVYRVTLPSGGLDADKWAGRPPPLAPEDLYTGPRSDGLLSAEDISGEYSGPGCVGCCSCEGPIICNSMTVAPLGADAIETLSLGCCCLPPLGCGQSVWGQVRTRDKGTNTFDMITFSADGTATKWDGVYKKRPGSQKRNFQKVETRDLAGNWRGCFCPAEEWPLSHFYWTTKKALDEDRYEESQLCCAPFFLPFPHCHGGTHTRKYVNGLPTNGFDTDGGDTFWHRDADRAAKNFGGFAKKIG